MTSAFRRKEMSGMSEEKKFHVQRNGRTQGPFSKANLKVSLKAGTLKATDLISVSHHGPWKAIADVPQLAKLLKPEPAVELFDHLYDDSAEKTYALYDEPTAPRKRSTAGEKKRSSRTSRITRSAVTAKSRASPSVPIQPEAEDKPRGIYKSEVLIASGAVVFLLLLLIAVTNNNNSIAGLRKGKNCITKETTMQHWRFTNRYSRKILTM